jgi:predicted metal-binding membrane protein
MRHAIVSRAMPIAGTSVVLIAGLLQFTRWKSRHLSSCCGTNSDVLPAKPIGALRYGVRLGIRCIYSCANLMAILVVAGVMDLRVMALVTAAITAERIAGRGLRIARTTGAVIVAAGLVLAVRG